MQAKKRVLNFEELRLPGRGIWKHNAEKIWGLSRGLH